MRKALVLAVSIVGLLFSVLLVAQDAVPPSPSQSQDDQTTIKSDVNLVSVYFTVRDKTKSLVSDLPQGRFRVFEDGKEQPIKFFARHSDVVLNVGLMLDTGTNMAWILNEEADASDLFLKHVVRKQDLGFVHVAVVLRHRRSTTANSLCGRAPDAVSPRTFWSVLAKGVFHAVAFAQHVDALAIDLIGVGRVPELV